MMDSEQWQNTRLSYPLLSFHTSTIPARTRELHTCPRSAYYVDNLVVKSLMQAWDDRCDIQSVITPAGDNTFKICIISYLEGQGMVFTTLQKWAAWSIADWEYLGRNTSGSSINSANRNNTLKYWYSWVVKIRNTSEAVLRPQYTPWPLYWPRPYWPWSV